MFSIGLSRMFSLCLLGHFSFIFLRCTSFCLFYFVPNVLKLVKILEFICLCKVNRLSSGVYEAIAMNTDFSLIERHGFKLMIKIICMAGKAIQHVSNCHICAITQEQRNKKSKIFFVFSQFEALILSCLQFFYVKKLN